MSETKAKIIDILEQEFENHLTLWDDYCEYVDTEELDYSSQDSLRYSFSDQLTDQGYFNQEIIGYVRAIEYLKENDPSLRRSLAAAYERGYTTENLDSELLACLLMNEILMEKFAEEDFDVIDLEAIEEIEAEAN